MTENSRLFLLDASSYLFRAYYAIGHLSNSKGVPTNATYGFLQMLLQLIKGQKPTHLVAVWDRPERNLRKDLFEAYKANRSQMPEDLAVQIPWIKRVLAAMKIPSLELPGYEADDLIGTIVHSFRSPTPSPSIDPQIVIVTGDKDLMQLVSDRVCLLDTMRGKWTRSPEVYERFGVGPEKVIEVLGLSGDTSDNIPGVPGIGEKTASQLIQQFGSIEELYQRINEVKGKRRETLEKNKELALLSKKLVTIHTDISLQFDFEDSNFNLSYSNDFFELLKELEFGRLLAQLGPELEGTGAVSQLTVSLDTQCYVLVNTPELLNQLLIDLANAPEFSFDTETTSLNTLHANLVGLSFSTGEKTYYIPVGHVTPLLTLLDQDPISSLSDPLSEDLPLVPPNKPDERNFQLNHKVVLSELKSILENSEKPKSAQNLKYDYQILKQAGVHLQGCYCDTMIAAYLLDPSESAGMDHLSLKYLGHKTITYEEVIKKDKSKTFAEVSLQNALEYSGEDAEVTYRLSQILYPKLKEEGLMRVYQSIELPLIPVLAEMELKGIKIDASYLENLREDFSSRLDQIEKKIYQIAGEEFNIQSPKQLGNILFEKLKLPVQRKTKTGYSTDVDVLAELARHHELPREILSFRSLAKLKSTYIDALLSLADPNTHRVHTSFNQTIAETGRLSSTGPNLQNIPIRTEEGRKIRRAIIAEEGFQLLSADYSQIELRILAHLSEDPALLFAFQNDLDVHRMTAASLFHFSEDQVTPSMRAVGKTVNFGVIYGQSAFGLSGQIGVSPGKAKEYIDQYFEKYQGVRRYREEVLARARETLEVRTLYGRRRKLPDLKSRNPNLRMMSERMAFNSVIQGTAADLIKLAMIRIDEKIHSQNLKSRMLLQVHDELVFEVASDEISLMKQMVQEQMEQVVSLKIPLKVDLYLAKNWAEGK